MRDISFDEMHLFTRVAELGTLSAVARERDVPVSQVSRTLSRLEKACGARLIHRSTHALGLTPEGDTFLLYCRRAVGTLDELEGEFAGQAKQASGSVRVAASSVMAQYLLVPSLPGLAQRHPQVRIELQVDDRMVDMARDAIDVAIRTGTPTTDTVVARQIGSLGRRLYATPGYLESFGTPQHPDDLHKHRLITNGAVTMLNHWPFKVKGKAVIVLADGRWSADNTSVTTQLALQGLGIARIATPVAEPLAQRGLLQQVLPDFIDEQPTSINAVTLSGRHRLPKIRACIDYWAEWFGQTATTTTTL